MQGTHDNGEQKIKITKHIKPPAHLQSKIKIKN